MADIKVELPLPVLLTSPTLNQHQQVGMKTSRKRSGKTKGILEKRSKLVERRKARTLSSFQVFSQFVKKKDGKETGEGILSMECVQLWLETRQTKVVHPEESFRRTLIAHIRGAYGRQPFSPTVEASLLRILRETEREGKPVNAWERCFPFNSSNIGKRGFNKLGYHEQQEAEKNPNKLKFDLTSGKKNQLKKGANKGKTKKFGKKRKQTNNTDSTASRVTKLARTVSKRSTNSNKVEKSSKKLDKTKLVKSDDKIRQRMANRIKRPAENKTTKQILKKMKNAENSKTTKKTARKTTQKKSQPISEQEAFLAGSQVGDDLTFDLPDASPVNKLEQLIHVFNTFYTREELITLQQICKRFGSRLVCPSVAFFLSNADEQSSSNLFYPTSQTSNKLGFNVNQTMGCFHFNLKTWMIDGCDETSAYILGRCLTGLHAFQLFESRLEFLLNCTMFFPELKATGKSWTRGRVLRADGASVGVLFRFRQIDENRCEVLFQEQSSAYGKALQTPLFL